jgi:hypothetical protein
MRVRPDAHGVIEQRIEDLLTTIGPGHRRPGDTGDPARARSSGTTTSTFILGRKFIVYLPPR